MRLLVIGVLAAALSVVLTVAVFTESYHLDQGRIPGFMGTGIAAKIDVLGSAPPYVLIEDETSNAIRRTSLASDGSFAARLAPGSYRLSLPNDSRSVTIRVPGDECVDVVLDFRIPGLVLTVPGEGWPIPRVAAA